MKTLYALIIAAVALLTEGCTSTKTLNPSSAKRLLQERLRTENQEGGPVSYAPIAALMGSRTFVDYQQDRFTGDNSPAALHRLLKAGFVKQVVVKSPYQNLTGTYTGRNPSASSSYTISMQQGSPMIHGTYKYDYCGGRISGSVSGDGSAAITVLSAGGFGSPCQHAQCDLPDPTDERWHRSRLHKTL